MNTETSTSNVHHKSFRRGTSKNRLLLIIFVLVFAAIGAILLFQSFAGTSTTSLFSNTAVPKTVDSKDTKAVELGVKFKSDVAGTVTSIRFYKSAANTGTHTGTLWSNTGAKLATATFTSETASGWQQVNFSTPVAIQANTIYVASYHTDAGHYSDDTNGLKNQIDSAPLHALANGASGANGLYAYGSSSSFPTDGWQASNYYVDVVFSPNPPADTTPPTVKITNANNSTVSGTLHLTGTASDATGVVVNTVTIDDTKSMFATGTTSWSADIITTSLTNAAHTFKVSSYDAAGNIGSATVTLTVNNTTAGALSVDKQVTTHQSSAAATIVSPSLTTTNANELLVAFLTSDGPNGTQSFNSVTGGNLSWTLRTRSNGQAGVTEIWQAVAPTAGTNVTVTATRATGSYTGSLVLTAFQNASVTANGATKAASASSGAPTASLTTTNNNSWIWAAGNDWDNATARTAGANQTKVDEYLGSTGDTYWVQRQTAPTPASGTNVTMDDSAPTSDRYNIAAIEILPSTATGPVTPPPDTSAPSTPLNLSASVASASQVNLAWTASTDNVAVTGYQIFRNGNLIKTVTGTTYSDSGLTANTVYAYTVKAVDAAGNVSTNSNTASVTTPQATDVTPPATPTNLTATAAGATSVNLAWTASTDNTAVAKYFILRNSSVIATVTAPATNYNDSTVVANTTYSYQIEAQDTAGNISSLSAPASVKTPNPTDTTPPSTPTNLTANVSGSSQVNLAWTSSTDNIAVAGYNVFRGTTKIGTTTTNSYGDGTVSASTTYSYTVQAYDGAGNTSPSSTAATAKTLASGGDPCAAANPTTTGFPCQANTGVGKGVTLSVASHNSTSCTNCPTGVTWSSGGYAINSCVSINGWVFNDDVEVRATNGNKGIYGTESAAISAACVKITNVLIAPPSPGSDAEVGLSTGFTNYNLQCSSGGVKSPCGPVYFADSEISMPQAQTSFSYATSNTNLHLWRVYLHGTSQGIDSDGYSEVHDSYMRADRSEAAMTGAAHGDAFFQDGGAAPWMLVDHSTLFCGAQMIDCNVDGALLGDNSAPNGAVISNNLFKVPNAYYCLSTGVSENKPFPVGSNIVIKNNVFETGPNGSPCSHGNAIKAYDPAVAASHNDKFCNNRMDDGSLVNASYETGSCP